MDSVNIDRQDDVSSMIILTSLGYFPINMGCNLSGRAPVLDLRCLSIVLVCMFPVSPSSSIPRRIWSPNYVITPYHRSLRVVSGNFLDILILLVISFIKTS